MKHPYRLDCDCPRCTKERARRQDQGNADARHARNRGAWTAQHQPRQRRSTTRRPAVGSQEWAETRGDDLGESEDR